MPESDVHITAAPVNPEAAMAFWKAKIPMTKKQAMALPEHERWKAFYIAGLADLDMVSTVHGAIGEALASGETLADFKKRIGPVIEAQGWKGFRVETIFRTNMQTTYAAGRYAKQQAVKKLLPFWRYVTVEDRRRRPAHAVLHGMVFPADHEFWDSNYPPNGFRCRCDVVALSRKQVERRGLKVETEIPRDLLYVDPKTGMEIPVALPGADRGFQGNPGKDWMKSLLDVTTTKLEAAPPELAAITVRKLAQGGLELWTKAPKGNFPLAVLKKADAESIGSAVTVACISPETWKKQTDHHPELTLADYWLAQEAVERGEKIRQDAKNMVFALNEAGGVLVVVKATKVGDELYITSLRRMSGDEAERERTLKKLRNR